MIIFFFKRNDLSTLATMVFVGLLLWFDGFLIPGIWHYNAPDKAPLYELMMNILPENKIFLSILSFLLLLIQAQMINFTAEKSRIIRKKKMLPGLVYIVLMSFDKSLLGMHPALLANFFLLFALKISIGDQMGKVVVQKLFNFGLLLSVAAMFYLPAYFFFVSVFFLRNFLSLGKLKGFIAAMLGFLTPFFFISNYYFFVDILEEKIQEFFQQFQYLEPEFVFYYSNHLVVFVYLGLLSILSMGYLLFSRLSDTTTSDRVRIHNVIMFFLFSVVAVIFSSSIFTGAALSFASSSIAIALLLVTLKRKWFSELVFGILLVLIVLQRINDLFFV